MVIQLFDMDVPYIVQNDVNDDGENFVRIGTEEADEEYHICIDKNGVEELIRVLNFIKKEL